MPAEKQKWATNINLVLESSEYDNNRRLYDSKEIFVFDGSTVGTRGKRLANVARNKQVKPNATIGNCQRMRPPESIPREIAQRNAIGAAEAT